MDDLLDLLRGLVLPLFLGVAGCTVRLMRFGVRSLRQLAASLITACFVAVIVHWGLDMFDLCPTVDAAIIGFCSYMGGSLLDAAQEKAVKAVDCLPTPGSGGN